MIDTIQELQTALELKENKLNSTLDLLEEVTAELERLQKQYKVDNVLQELKAEVFWRNIDNYSLSHLEDPGGQNG